MFGQAFPREVIVLGSDVKQRAAGMTNQRQQIINALMNAASKDATGDVAMVGAGDVEAAPAASSSTGEAGAKTTAKAVVDFGDIPDVGPVASSSAGDAAPTEEADVETTTQPAYFAPTEEADVETPTVVDGPARRFVIEAVDDIADHTPSPASLVAGGAAGSPAVTGSLMETGLARAALMHMLRSVRGLINEHPELVGTVAQNLEQIQKNLDEATGPNLEPIRKNLDDATGP